MNYSGARASPNIICYYPRRINTFSRAITAAHAMSCLFLFLQRRNLRTVGHLHTKGILKMKGLGCYEATWTMTLLDGLYSAEVRDLSRCAWSEFVCVWRCYCDFGCYGHFFSYNYSVRGTVRSCSIIVEFYLCMLRRNI